MNEHEIGRIAAAMHELRPDWPVASLRTLIAKNLATRDRRDVAVALAWVACESGTATPARVLEAGPWWRATNAGEDTNRPPKADEACLLCGRWVKSCICEEPTTRPLPTADPRTREQAIAEARSALRRNP